MKKIIVITLTLAFLMVLPAKSFADATKEVVWELVHESRWIRRHSHHHRYESRLRWATLVRHGN
jgi:hypothetical protein